jgi:hypothetical protein
MGTADLLSASLPLGDGGLALKRIEERDHSMGLLLMSASY